MKKALFFIITTLCSLIIGFLFYLAYIHVISWLALPLGVLIVGAVVFVFLAAFGNLLANLKDFFVSIFKDDQTRNEKGFKKHL